MEEELREKVYRKSFFLVAKRRSKFVNYDNFREFKTKEKLYSAQDIVRVVSSIEDLNKKGE